jgi:hypothetical protein
MISGYGKFQPIFRVTLMENLDDVPIGWTPFPFGENGINNIPVLVKT